MPRARRASAPSRVFLNVDLSPWKFTFLNGEHVNFDSNRAEVLGLKVDLLPIISSQSPYMPVDHTSFHATAVDLHQDHIDDIDTNDCAQQREVRESLCDVARATPSVWGKMLIQNKYLTHLSFDQSSTSLPLFGQSTIKAVEYERHSSAMGLKFSRTFNFGRTDKMPSFRPDDAHEHANAKYDSRSHDNDKLPPTPIKSTHPHSPKLRPLRRKNHLNIMPCAPSPDSSEPIAISLTLHHSSPPPSPHVGKNSSQRFRPHSHTRAHSHPQSISSDSDPVNPVTPTYQRSPPTSFQPPKTSSPVRLGHPSRPYYTAIRKNVSPPSPSRSRPHTADAPMTSTAITTNDSRHLSMSAMPASSTLGVNDDNEDFEVRTGPTNSARLSLTSILHRQSYDTRTQTHARNAQSLSRAANGTISNRTIGIGCSMSGETELRMALAASSPSGAAITTSGRRPTTEDEFRFRETVVPSQNKNNNDSNNIQNSFSTNTGTGYLPTRHVGSRDSFMGRVKKLRKGLKEMLMN